MYAQVAADLSFNKNKSTLKCKITIILNRDSEN